MNKYGVRFERDALSWMFGKIVGSAFGGGINYYYMVGETTITGRGPGTIMEPHVIATRVYGSHGYYYNATAAATAWGTFLLYTTTDTIHTSSANEIEDGYTNLEQIVKPATNCTRVDATFGYFETCDFNDTFKSMFMRSFCGTGADAQLGSQHLIGIVEIDLVGLDPNNYIEMYQESYSIGSYGVTSEDSEGTWVATMVYFGTHNLSAQTVYPTEVVIYGSIAYSSIYPALARIPIEEFLDGKPIFAVNDIVHATIYVEF